MPDDIRNAGYSHITPVDLHAPIQHGPKPKVSKRPTAAERRAAEAEARDKAVFAALAWPQEPCPQPYSKEKMGELLGEVECDHMVRAWTFNAYSRHVTHGAFRSGAHVREGDGRSFRITHSQTSGGPWFATEAEARLAMRWAVCREMASALLGLVEAEARAIVKEAEPVSAQ